MTTIRVSKRTRFTVIDRATVNDADLSYRARGVLLWLLDKPDDWHTDSSAIARASTGERNEGRDAIRAALKELEACGYLTRERKRDKFGRWTTEVFVLERPAPENPSLDAGDARFDSQPGPENPASVNQALSTEDCKPKTDGSCSDNDFASQSSQEPARSPWGQEGVTWREWCEQQEVTG